MTPDDDLINEYGSACLSIGQFQEAWSVEEWKRRRQRVVKARKALVDYLVLLRTEQRHPMEVEYQLQCYYWSYCDNPHNVVQKLLWRTEGYYTSIEKATQAVEQMREDTRHPAIKDYRIIKVEIAGNTGNSKLEAANEC